MKLTFLQMPLFRKQWQELGLSDDDLSALERQIIKNPQGGQVMVGTGGIRKCRFAPPSSHRGKRGSNRVCYAYFASYAQVYLFNIFAKSAQENLSAQEKQALKNAMTEIKDSAETARCGMKKPMKKKPARNTTKKRSAGRMGPQLIEAVTQLRDALRAGGPLETHFTVRTVQIPQPQRYGLDEVQKLRKSLSMSQSVFASLLGVSPELVENWEQGRSVPRPWARRLMDLVAQNPSKIIAQTVRTRARAAKTTPNSGASDHAHAA